MSRAQKSVNLSGLRGLRPEYPLQHPDLLSKAELSVKDSLSENTQGFLFGILLHILSKTQLVEAVLPNLFDEVRRKATQFSKQKDQPLTWLILIAHRQAIERLCREVTSRSDLDARDDEYGTNGLFINISEQRRAIRAGMRLIPDSESRMLELSLFFGLSHSQIAKELGLTSEDVDVSLKKATRHIFNVVKSLRFSNRRSTGAPRRTR